MLSSWADRHIFSAGAPLFRRGEGRITGQVVEVGAVPS